MSIRPKNWGMDWRSAGLPDNPSEADIKLFDSRGKWHHGDKQPEGPPDHKVSEGWVGSGNPSEKLKADRNNWAGSYQHPSRPID